MVEVFRTETCCGVREIGNLECKGAEVVREVYHGIQEDDKDGAFFWFADNVENENGRKLAAYIKKYKLGEVLVTPKTFNPQSEHEIEMFVWILDHDALTEWIERFGEFS